MQNPTARSVGSLHRPNCTIRARAPGTAGAAAHDSAPDRGRRYIQPSAGGHMDISQERRLITDVPGPRTRAMIGRREAAIPRGVFQTTPVFVEAASGAILRDPDGNQLIDMGAGLAVLNTGNTAQAVVTAVRDQLERFTHTCFHVTMHEPYVELAERLNALVPGRAERKTMFTNSGAEAVENAVKIARHATGRSGVVVFDHAFHGRTLLGMTMTAKAMPYKSGLGPFAPEVYRLPFSYPYRCPTGGKRPEECAGGCAARAIDLMEKQIGPEDIACLVVEPILGEGGFVVPGPGFLASLAEYCRHRGILFVADEVQTGIGRTGRWFGIEHEGVEPDLVTTAKSLAGGLPLGAVTGRAEVMDSVHVGGLGGTFGGNPLSCAAALAVLADVEARDLLARAASIGQRMHSRLQEMAERASLIGEVRGRGAMMAMELVEDLSTKEPAKRAAARVIQECYTEGVIVLKAGTYDNVIRLLPPLTIDDGLLDEALDVLEKAVGRAAGETG
jgi:4-aminobutyrate aminotransferase / (S)-3-amino-2-methylpropionate transaminase / 5-aminovalerate transaminase